MTLHFKLYDSFYYNHQTMPLAIFTPKPVQQAIVSEPTIERPRLALLDWPSDQQIHLSKEMAYRSLFKQWGIIYKSNNGSAFRQARAQGLGCLEEQSSLSSLLQLNRPAVFKLYDDQGREFYATLTALQGRTATFIAGTEPKPG